MGLQISYGGGYDGKALDAAGRTAVVFTGHQVLSFVESSVRDPGDCDVELRHFRIQVGAWLSSAGATTGNSDILPAQGDIFSNRLQDTIDILSTPRLPLTATLNGEVIISVPQVVAGTNNGVQGATYRCDSRNGPLPSRPALSKWTGNKACYLIWEVETWIQVASGYPNVPQNSLQPIVLSHRWSEEQVVGDDHNTTRTIQGRVVFARNVLTRQGWQPDDFRNFLLRSVPNRYYRTLVRSKVDSAGLSCDYTTVEQTRSDHTSSLSEILHFTASIRKGFQTAPGLFSIPNFHCDLNITVRGRPNTSRATLLQAAMSAASWFGFSQANADRFGQFAQFFVGQGAAAAPGSSPCYRCEGSMSYDKREFTLSCGFISGKDVFSDAANFDAAVQIVGFDWPFLLAPLTCAKGGQRGQSGAPYFDNPAPQYGGGFADIYAGRMLVQVPNRGFGLANVLDSVGAPPTRGAPVAGPGEPLGFPSIDPLSGSNTIVG